MKRILFITVAFFMSFVAMAQENEEWFGHDVEGFCIGQRMNYKQFVANELKSTSGIITSANLSSIRNTI